MNKCCIMQPTYFPWVGYFDLIDQSDYFVFYDDVQFSKQSWQSRNRIKTANGIININIPIKKAKLNTHLNKIEINNQNHWKKKQLKTLKQAYGKTPFFAEIYSFINTFFEKENVHLSLFNINLITEISKRIGIVVDFICSSELLNSKEGEKDIRLINICKELDCNHYLSTTGAASYINRDIQDGAFSSNKIKLEYHNYYPVEYSQKNGEFEPYLSIIDLLFNVGFGEALFFIRAGRNN